MGERYYCFLNRTLYGNGSLEYMNELFNDYAVNSKMYGKNSCNFEIIREIRFKYLGENGESTHNHLTVGQKYLIKSIGNYDFKFLAENGSWYMCHSDEFIEWVMGDQ